ncbi:MAG TPA: RNA 2',3'-cyclic phosphodiesterase [Gaiellaceae bacterium]|nr:RNA 2',3'-cyclic phosphodiesterase [Gaiellaceae bacterium]
MAGDERIRLFCALQLPAWALDELVEWQSRHLRGGGRQVRRGDLHVTLAFLGARPAGEVQAIARELHEAAAAAGTVELRPLRYRETRSVGMLVFEDAGAAARALADDLHGRLERLGVYRRERRPWLPHVTLLRFRERAGVTAPAPNMRSIHVVRSALYRSHLGRDGARYEVLETAALGGS